MFQNFDKPKHVAGGDRLARLRKALAADGLAGLIVLHADEYQSEYLPPSAERLVWLTGFSGSAGTAVVLQGEAAIFVDGRYTLQAANEVDPAQFAVVPLADTSPADWIATRLKPGERIGLDARLATIAEARRYSEAAARAGAELVLLDEAPLDAVWTDRPAPPVGNVDLHPIEFAGEESGAKVSRLATLISERRADALVLAAADSIAWIFNIRGSDIGRNPLVLAHAILRREGRPSLFVDARKLSNAVRAELATVAEVETPAAFFPALRALGEAKSKVILDPHAVSAAIDQMIRSAGGTVVEAADPTQLVKARKNPVELEGMRRAHIRDGVAMVRFLAWLDREAPSGNVDEIGAAEALERFRAETAAAEGMELRDLAFDTISGAGPNGAIVHYRVSRHTNRRLEQDSLYLIDSGGQYRDGTTDITRTVAIGTPTAEMRRNFTLVLKGHIALSEARFPKGTIGAQLDPFARQYLWRAGMDYDHGTGHGVGAYLSVHEGPARLSKLGTVPLEPGMILSNEPGYYRTGAYGIRIENLVAVTEPEAVPGGDRPMMGFEVLSLCPIDRRLIDQGLLGPEQSAWLDGYHRRVRETLGPRLTGAERQWLDAATKPIH